MGFFKKGNIPQKKKTDKAKQQTGKKSKQPAPVVNQTQNSSTQEDENFTSTNDTSNVQKQIVIRCPEKKESIFSPTNMLTLAAVIASGLAVYFASESNRQVAKQFEIENRPYIILDKVIIDTIYPERRIVIFVYVKNIKDNPPLIIERKQGAVINTEPILKKLHYNADSTKDVNLHLEKGKDFQLNYAVPPLSYIDYMMVKSNRKFIYVYGEIIFLDIITNKKYSYSFCLGVNIYGAIRAVPPHNAFKEIKD